MDRTTWGDVIAPCHLDGIAELTPGIDFGQWGKSAVRFSYASSEENTYKTTGLGQYRPVLTGE